LRLGAPIEESYDTPEQWASLVVASGYGAAYCPVDVDESADAVAAYAASAQHAGIVIGEVGAWSNPLSRDRDEAERSLELCKRSLRLADQIEARCCVNIAGSRGDNWAGPSRENYSSETFERIVAVVQEVIDTVQPTRTFFALEVMPWIAPDSVDSYLRLIDEVDRDRFAVHFDPVNLINQPYYFYHIGEIIERFVAELGPRIRSCHVKDVRLDDQYPPWTFRVLEARPGTGEFDWAAMFRQLDRLDPDLPVLLEHLDDPDAYRESFEFLVRSAAEQGVTFRRAQARTVRV
jgi:sugar phosphate isomerase/epimerase